MCMYKYVLNKKKTHKKHNIHKKKEKLYLYIQKNQNKLQLMYLKQIMFILQHLDP